MDDCVVILNGFQISQDVEIQDRDELFLIRKGEMPEEAELAAMLAARHTPYVYDKVRQGRVAIAGLGGIGSNVAAMLARTGVGHLLLVDFDVVEPSNLNRQCYFVSHLGLPKVEAMERQIRQINPFISVECRCVKVDESNVEELFNGYDVVCEAFDDPKSKAMLVNQVLEKLPNSTVVASSGMAGYESCNSIRTVRRMRTLYVCGDFESEAAVGNGLMAPRVQVCAGHQANMILRLLLGIVEP